MRDVLSPFLLVATALIWGGAFLAQKEGGTYLGPFAFTVARSLLGGIALLGVLAVRRACGVRAPHADEPGYWRNVLLGGFGSGFWLFVASMFQQTGLQTTLPGVSAFLTTTYVLLVPLLGIFAGRAPRAFIWPMALLAVAGLHHICIPGGAAFAPSIGRGEGLTLAGAFLFAVQILVVDRYAYRTDVVAMTCVQFFTGALLGLPFLLLPAESARLALGNLRPALPAIVFCGVISSGVAYTLQNMAQARTPPAVAALLLSLESVFAALFGYFIRHDVLAPRQVAGCGLVFLAVAASQILDIVVPRKQRPPLRGAPSAPEAPSP
ncbi:MAG: DMT family transporter [Kiritimatiellia bacterium]|jgi:drug/metabolite transporter (DMT)-like permease